MSLALILGGGAPNMTLLSGALAALDEQGVAFDVVSTSGAGMLIGLLYAAPKCGDRQQALRDTQSMGVSDSINRAFPIDYKVFQKVGPMANAYRTVTQPWLEMMPTDTPSQKLMRDSAELLNAMLCPSGLNPWSKGLCEQAPWVTDVVDFEALRNFAGEFYMSAYNIDRHQLEIFGKDEITAEHFKAALSMPFIYPPYKLNGQHYIEGCVVEILNYEALERRSGPPMDYAIVFDIIGHQKIIQQPQNLYDALSQMIMVPLTRLAKYDTDYFIKVVEKEKKINTGVLLLDFEDLIPDSHWPEILHWSEKNMTLLYDVGYRAGARFFERHKDILTPKTPKAAAKVTKLEDSQVRLAG